MYLMPQRARGGRLGILPTPNITAVRRMPALFVARHRYLNGMGVMTPTTATDGTTRPCPAWGCGGPRRIPQYGAAPAASGAVTGTPVPAGFPTNQLFIHIDGSEWIYSAAQSKWISAGTPINVNAAASTAATPASTTPATTTVITAPAPAAAPADSSGYQSILDWFPQSTLISGVPNWAIAIGAGLLIAHMMKPAAAQGRY
jgi:hypothetical protein